MPPRTATGVPRRMPILVRDPNTPAGRWVHVATPILDRVRGIDRDGDLIIAADLPALAGAEYLIALTSCCQASGKGGTDIGHWESGIVCRGCYQTVHPKFGGRVDPDEIAYPVHATSATLARLVRDLGIPRPAAGGYAHPVVVGIAMVNHLVTLLSAEETNPVLDPVAAINAGRQMEWLAGIGYGEARVRKTLAEALGVAA